MSTIYELLAPFYDEWNRDIDYEAWADFLDRTMRMREGGVREVLDLCCGTGSMTLPLARRGYDMVGVDISPDMLAVASARAALDACGKNILFLCQDMRELELYGTVQAVVSTLDSMNHLTGAGDFARTLALVHNYLEPDGLFIFDVNSRRKFEEAYADRTYTMEKDGNVIVWENDYNKKSGICHFGITLFALEADGRYSRYTEYQKEKYYSLRSIRRHLKQASFELLAVKGESFLDATDDDYRLHIIARAIK